MDHDGTKNGYPCDTFARLAELLPIPIIASGGAGTVDHIADVLTLGTRRRGIGRQYLPLQRNSDPRAETRAGNATYTGQADEILITFG